MLINCGNGGDFEFEQDRIYWVTWIKLNIRTNNFRVYSESGIPGDKALVAFDDPRDLTMFALTAPVYVPQFNSIDMDPIFKGRDALVVNR